jgi:hypothetical protein
VIGVTRDISTWDISHRPVPSAYVPYVYVPARDPGVLVRVSGDPTRMAEPVRETLRAVDALMPVSTLQSMNDVHKLVFWRNRLLTSVFLCFGAIAIFLGSGTTVRAERCRSSELRRRCVAPRRGRLPE